MRLKGIPKIIIKKDHSEWVYCPDCKTYLPYYDKNGEMTFPKWKNREVGVYCLKHHAARQAIRNPRYYNKHYLEIAKQQRKYKLRTGRVKPRSENEERILSEETKEKMRTAHRKGKNNEKNNS